MQKSIFDMDENLVAACSYIFGPISGIVVLVLEKENKFVRFHALQSTIWFLFLMVVTWVLTAVSSLISWIPIIGWVTGGLFGIVFSLGGLLYIGSKIFLFIQAYSQKTWKIPIIGDVCWSQVNK